MHHTRSRAATAALVTTRPPASPAQAAGRYLVERGLALLHSWRVVRTRRPAPFHPPLDIALIDIALTSQDRFAFRRALAQAFRSDADADGILTAVGYPRERRRSIDHSTPELAWAQTLTDLDNGVIEAPYRMLLLAALDRFPYNRTFRSLGERYGLSGRSR